MRPPSPSFKNSRAPNFLARLRASLQRTDHLIRRACAAFQEGGISFVIQRFRRWAQHQYGRLFSSRSYQRWIAENTPTSLDLNRQREWATSQPDPLFISIVCPLYRTPPNILQETIRSVVNQSYPYWELCLTLCAEESSELKSVVFQFANADPRIRVVGLERNRGISKNTNSALENVQGSWVAFLDHDDILAPDALYTYAQQISERPDCDVLYSDEDLISSTSRFRRSPMLKPDWSPEMLLHFNYICHFVAVRRAVLQQVGQLRSEVDGAQDWDLLLRITEQTQRVRHVPKILYHWRELSTSTAAQRDAKPYVVEAQKRVVKDALQRRGITAQVDLMRNGHCHPRWEISSPPLVSIIIPNRDQPKLIQQVVAGILRETDYQNIELILVDNQSTDPEVLAFYEAVRQERHVRVIGYHQPFNYSAACNRGVEHAQGDFLLFLNSDIEIIHKDWLTEILKWAIQPGVGIVGSHLLYPNGRTQHAGLVLGLFGLVGHTFYQCASEEQSPLGSAGWVRNVTAVTGACQLISRELFNQLGGYDEGYRLLYSDIDLCLRVRQQGLRIVYTPHSQLVHHEAATRKSRKENEDDARRFAERLATLKIETDPYYHPLLSARATVPQLKLKQGMSIAQNLQHEMTKYLDQDDSKTLQKRAA